LKKYKNKSSSNSRGSLGSNTSLRDETTSINIAIEGGNEWINL